MAGERLLVVEDRAAARAMLRDALQESGYRVCEAEDLREADAKLQTVEFDAVLADVCLPHGSGIDLLERLPPGPDGTPVILLTAYATVAQAVEAMKRGAFDFLAKPYELDRLLVVVERALERRRLARQQAARREADESALGAPALVGESPAFQRAMSSLKRVAPSDATVLLLGESGCGKDLFARALHRMSRRADGPWVAINCAALPRELVESELFGAEKGAYTGATRRRLGKVEAASGGTLFLDEVGELDPSSQAKLLRVLEERCIERLGGHRSVHVDVRLVAATNRDLTRAVAERRFREDLLYRLQVFPITIPPLRERGEDVLLLAEHFLARFASEMRRSAPSLAPAARERLRGHAWPGNVRELRNAVERALILSDRDLLGAEVFEPDEGSPPSGSFAPEGAWPSLKEVARRAASEAELALIRRALEATGGNRTRAAVLLGVTAKTLWTRLRETGEPGGEEAEAEEIPQPR